MPATALTAREIDLIRSSKEALANFDAAKGDARVWARQRLERIQIELEKLRSPDAEALRLIKQSLKRPIDPLAKAQSTQKAGAPGRSERFNKLMLPTGADALAK
jgi:hypothetical protein